MKQKKLKLKGLKTPKCLVFLYGFVNGRMKTAAINGEHGHLDAAYIHGRTHLFDELCKKRIIQLEKELSEARAEAETLMLELPSLTCPAQPQNTGAASGEGKLPDTVTQAQICRDEAAAAKRFAERQDIWKQQCEEVLARRSWIIRRLVKIREQLTLSERVCAEELSAVAHALQERFCIYCHGALLKPVHPGYLAPVEFAPFMANYRANHEMLKQMITNVLEKEA